MEYRTCKICGKKKAYNLRYFVKRIKGYKNVCLQCYPICKEQKLQYNREFMKKKREVYIKYNGKCANCGSEEDLHIHHKVYRSESGSNDIDNLILLCKECHIKEHEGEEVEKLLIGMK